MLLTFRSLLFVSLLVLSLTVGVQAAPLNYVINGDFENLVVPNSLGPNGGYFCKSGSSCISNVQNWSSICRSSSCGNGATPDSLLFANTGGSAFNGNIGLYQLGQNGTTSNSPVPNSPTGGNYVAFDGDPTYNASVSQVITGLTAGTTYTLMFYQGAAQQNGQQGATTEHWQVTFANQTVNSQQMSNAAHGWVPWMLQIMQFTLSANSTGTETLTFLAMGAPGGLPPIVLLDGVSLSTPEPKTLGLVAIALGGLVLLRKRGSAVR